MFTIEFRFKDGEREVPLDRFVESILQKAIEPFRRELHQLKIPASPSNHHIVEQRESEIRPRAVGIKQTAEMLGLSAATIRRYVSHQRIHFVRVGSRVLIPMETIDKILVEGIGTKR
jgi:excisionase family DNA binding protein